MPNLVIPRWGEIILLVPLVGFLLVQAFHLLRRKPPMREVAPLLGLEYRNGWFAPRRMVGEVEGVYFEISRTRKPIGLDGPDLKRYIIFRAKLGDETPEGLTLLSDRAVRSKRYRSNLAEVITTARGREVGLPHLEQVCSIWGDDIEQVRRYLSRPGVEDLLLELMNESSCAYIEDGELVYYEPGDGEYAFEYDALLERLAEAARVLDGAPPAGSSRRDREF